MAQPPDGGGQTASVFFPPGIGRRQLGNRNPAPRDLDGLAFRGPLEQLIEVSLGVECTHGFHVCHYLMLQTS